MNFYARLLQGDIHKKRPGLEIEPGHFINSLPDYSMIIRKDNNGLMEDVRSFRKKNYILQKSSASVSCFGYSNSSEKVFRSLAT